MTLTCPACRKSNDTGEALCARCGCDLGPLRAVEAAAEKYLATAILALHQKRWPAAFRHAEQSWSLRRSPAAARLAFLAAAAAGYTLRAITWHARAVELDGKDCL